MTRKLAHGEKTRLSTAILAVALVVSACGGGGDRAPYRVAFVLSRTGAGSAPAAAAQQGMDLALAEVNADSAGPPSFAVTTVDDASDPKVAAQACQRAVSQDRVSAIIGYESAAAMAACNGAARQAGIPYIGASESTGDVCAANLFQVGAIPNQRAEAAVGFVMTNGVKRLYLVGSDDSVSRATLGAAAKLVASGGGTVVGTQYLPVGTTDFSGALAKIAAAHPQAVVELFSGPDGVAFYRAALSDSRTSGLHFASLELDEAGAKAIGSRVSGVTGIAEYFAGVQTTENQRFVAALRSGHADGALPSLAAALSYDAMHLLAAAVRSAGSTDAAAVIAAIPGASIMGPQGSLSFPAGGHFASANLYLGRAAADGHFDLLSFRPGARPQPGCS